MDEDKSPVKPPSDHLLQILELNPGVDSSYRHGPKRVTPGEMIEPAGAALKWYAVHPEDRPVPEEITRLARSYLSRTPLEATGLGFVIAPSLWKRFLFPDRLYLARLQRSLGDGFLQGRKRHE